MIGDTLGSYQILPPSDHLGPELDAGLGAATGRDDAEANRS